MIPCAMTTYLNKPIEKETSSGQEAAQKAHKWECRDTAHARHTADMMHCASLVFAHAFIVLILDIIKSAES
jgi:hypothetical protein